MSLDYFKLKPKKIREVPKINILPLKLSLELYNDEKNNNDNKDMDKVNDNDSENNLKEENKNPFTSVLNGKASSINYGKLPFPQNDFYKHLNKKIALLKLFSLYSRVKDPVYRPQFEFLKAWKKNTKI